MRRVLLFLTSVSLVVAGCGGSDSSGDVTTTATGPATRTTTAMTTAPTTQTTTPAATTPTTTAMTTEAPATIEPAGLAVAIDVDGEAGFFDPAPFTASGPAVDAGFICAGGTLTHEDYVPEVPKQRESWTGVFACNDDGGVFELAVEVSYSMGAVLYEWGDWSVLAGHGALVGLTGSGTTEITCDGDNASSCHEVHDGHVAMPPGKAVEIDVDAAVVDGIVDGTFTAQGPAVDAGFVCPAGSYSQSDAHDNMAKRTSTWKGIYLCDDGSGTFTLDVATSFTPGETLYHVGDWTVLGGTGSYVDLTGSGTVHVECVNPESPVCHEDNDGRVDVTS